MDTSIAKEVIRVIRAERDRRLATLETEDDPISRKMAEDRWYEVDEPFVNEFCLMLLVAIWHQVERDLVFFAAQEAAKGEKLDAEHKRRIEKELKKLQALISSKDGWEKFYTKLGLDAEAKWLEVLRRLANLYKHEAGPYPNEKVLKHLGDGADQKNYLSIPESQAFKEDLAEFLELSSHADYSDIAEAFLDRVSGLLSRQSAKLGVRYYRASLDNFGV